MLDIKFIRENIDLVKKACELKRESVAIDGIISLDKEVLKLKSQMQELLTQKNALSKKISNCTAEAKPDLIQEGKDIGVKIQELKPRLLSLETKLESELLRVPLMPSPLAPIGKDDSDNVEIKKWGVIPSFDFSPKDHVEILERQNWAEFERVANVAGSRSYSLRNEMLLLEMSLWKYALDILRSKNFNLVSVPAFARESALTGTGHFPGGRDQVYHLPEDDLFLSGTAEVQINSFHAGEILNEDHLPMLYAGFSPCFRREAGSYGRDVRGLIRVHQFMKVEQFIICKNDDDESTKWHQVLLETSEEIVKGLELPYRIVECCTGDMGTGKYRMFDIECWVPSESKYRETHSCSSLHDWQARRTNTRYRDKDGVVRMVHTLNNTAIATPRILVPFLENHQMIDGRIKLPEAIRPYMGNAQTLGKVLE